MFLDRPGNWDRLPARWERTLKPLNSHADANRSFPKCEGHKEATFNYNQVTSTLTEWWGRRGLTVAGDLPASLPTVTST